MEVESNLPLSERFRKAGEAHADADAAASLLENLKSAVLAEKVLAYPDLSIAKAETTVKASAEWKDHIEKMVAARKLANRCKVEMEFLRMRFYEWNSHEATQRHEMRITR